MKKQSILFSLVFVWLICLSGISQTIDRIEPPHWYAGMNNPNLQLMIYGNNVSKLFPEVKGRGVKITNLHRVENPNYLFIDLKISDDRKSGTFDILFRSGKKVFMRKQYELKERRKNSANRTTFTGKDVMYLITPDRFANGDSSNDEIKGMKQGLNREDEHGRHGGDLRGIINNLDYIEDMGFTAIWLNPIVENDQDSWSYHGYATTDYYKVDRRFGSNEEYLELSHKAKEKGIGIIMDQIANHCGHQHWWMSDPPTSDWVNNQDKPYQGTNHRKYTVVDPYAAPEERRRMVEGWFVETMPDLNQKNEFMSTYLIQNSIWWIEYADLYGIRQDTYSYPFKDFMTDWTCAIESEYPDFNIVGEEWVDDPALISYWQKGKVNHDGYTSCLRSIMDFPLNFILAKAMNEKEEWGKGLVRLYEHLGRDYHYPSPMDLVTMADNHDMSRIYEQINKDYTLFEMSMAYLLTMRGIPQIFYGTEILMDHPESTSHGMIRSDFPGGWKGDPANAFNGRNMKEESLNAQHFLKTILNWRKQKTVIHTGKLMHYEPQKGVYVYFRYNENESVMVVLNKNEKPIDLNLDRFKGRTEGYTSTRNIINGESLPLGESLKLNKKGALILELLE